jgi:hypothetical protein
VIIVVPDPLQSNQTSGRVIRFGPRKSGLRVIRGGKSFSGNTDLDNSPVPDLSRYQSGESSEEYRHRMIVNAVAFAYTSLLVIAGVCLALKMAHA